MRSEDRMRGLSLGRVVKCWDCQSSIEGQHRPECEKTPKGGILSSWGTVTATNYAAARAAAKEFNSTPIDKKTERKMTPLWSGLVKYFPDALIAVARLSQVANDQHNPGEPLHWARGKSMDQEDCLLRHLWEAGTVDTDGQRHSSKVAWRALALLQLELEAAGEGGKIL